jgi:putative acetyltransferase
MPQPEPVRIVPALFPDDLAAVRSLFGDYVDSLGVDLSFQDVAAVFSDLPGKYAPPGGAILIARDRTGTRSAASPCGRPRAPAPAR